MTPTSGGSLVGKQLGDFQLQGLLGAGGMAEVYRGFDVKLKRQVAVKILPASMANDAGYVQRFKTEAQRVAALNHPHIVPVYHFGEDGQLLYHVMPILKESLRDRLDREVTLEPQDAVRLVVQIASALSVAHAAGLVHRDVKPENILLDEKGEAYLTDFGIARPVMPSRVGRAAQTLSATGLPVGTPEYMAPEQLRGEPMDQRADIYALGAVLYELLTGHAPHEAETPYEVAAMSLMGKIDPPSALVPGIPEELEDVIMIALASDPAARYPDASSFAFAARRSVFPRGRSLLTGLPGLRRATRENIILSRPRRLSRADEPTHPLSPRATRAIWAMPGGGKGGTGATAIDGALLAGGGGRDRAGGDAVWRGVLEPRPPNATAHPRLLSHRDRWPDGHSLAHCHTVPYAAAHCHSYAKTHSKAHVGSLYLETLQRYFFVYLHRAVAG